MRILEVFDRRTLKKEIPRIPIRLYDGEVSILVNLTPENTLLRVFDIGFGTFDHALVRVDDHPELEEGLASFRPSDRLRAQLEKAPFETFRSDELDDLAIAAIAGYEALKLDAVIPADFV